MGVHQPWKLLGERVSDPYGPFVVVHWLPHPWGVIAVSALAQPQVLNAVLSGPPEASHAWLALPKTATEPLVPTKAAALLRVAALLKEAVRHQPENTALLMAARVEVLAELWSLIDAAEPALPRPHALSSAASSCFHTRSNEFTAKTAMPQVVRREQS